LIIVGKQDDRLWRAFRNIPGVEVAHVDRLNLLQLAPGGHLGRFCIWTQEAFEQLDRLYGTYSQGKRLKGQRGRLPRAKATNADLTRIINSDEVQSQLKAGRRIPRVPRQRKNPLKNRTLMHRLNPYERTRIRAQLLKERKPRTSEKRDPKISKQERQRAQARLKKRSAFYKTLLSNPVVYETDKPKAKPVAPKLVLDADQ